MKRFLMISTIAATAAFAMPANAMTEAEMTIIERYAGEMTVPTTLSETDVAGLMNIINGGSSEGEKRADIQNFLSDYPQPEENLVLTEAPNTNEAALTIIERYAGDTPVPPMSDSEIDGLVNIINGGDSEGDKRADVQNALTDYATNGMMTKANAEMVPEAEYVIIERYAGDMMVPKMMEPTDVAGLMNIINGGSSEGEKRADVQNYLSKWQ